MHAFIQVASVLAVAVAMALSLAHALERPGKSRLNKEQYLAVQTIYYPGFTIGGAAEPVGLLLLLLLLVLTPVDGAAFALTAGAFAALAAMHAAYWLLTHPVNRFWLEDYQPKGLGGRFFAFGAGAPDRPPAWTVLRDRWEFSHMVRAGLGTASLVMLAASLAV